MAGRPVVAEQAASRSPSVHAGHRAQGAGGEQREAGAQGGQVSPRRRARDNDKKEKPTYRIRVSGFPPYTQSEDLGRTFSKYGSVWVDKINARAGFAILAYSTEEEANEAIQANKKVNVYGEFLNVRHYTDRDNKQNQNKRDFPRTKQKGLIVEPKDIDLSGDFYRQVDQVLSMVRLTQEEVTTISTLYTDLERVLQALWPGCTAMPFGSITTGLGIKTSDADCFVLVPGLLPHHQHSLVPRAKRILQAHPQLFAEILPIPRANTPIIKFFHVPTETNCDLSFKTPLGTQNSKLIAFLLHLDPRLIPVAVLIKYWAKVHGLSGTGRLTNYALTMMIIFYLQQPPMSILPAVEWLQRDRKNDVIVDNWNTGFLQQKECIPPCSNTSSIAELFGGFFEYYSLFNFDEMVVCPFLGMPLKKECFIDLNKIPPQYERYKFNVLNNLNPPIRSTNPMCVQDPFEQCHNVASAVTNRLASDLKAYFKFAANAYEKEKLNGCKDLLRSILLEKPKIVKMKMHPEFRINLYPKVIQRIVQPDWKTVVRDLTFVIFGKMLKISLGKVEEKINPDAKKEKERYMGTLTKAIWKRKQFTRLYTVIDLDMLEKEEKITEEILNVEKETFNIQFQLTLAFGRDPKSAAVMVKLSNGDIMTFKEFGKFYLSAVYAWYMAMLEPYNIMKDPPVYKNKIQETIRMIDRNNDLDSDDDDDEAEGADDDENARSDCDNDGHSDDSDDDAPKQSNTDQYKKEKPEKAALNTKSQLSKG